jgi:hypothetical protein
MPPSGGQPTRMVEPDSGTYTGVCTQCAIVLDAPARMFTMNYARGTANRFILHALTDQWRTAMKDRALALKVPHFGQVRIHCWPYQAKGTLADTGSHMPVLKACVDGLRDAGVLTDDTGREVLAITMHAPARGPNGVKLELRGVLATASSRARPKTH